MADLVERLRKDTMHWYDESLAHAAADEIERLRAIINQYGMDTRNVSGTEHARAVAKRLKP